MSWINFDYFKHRKLRVDIITLFLILLGTSLIFSIAYSYFESSKSILAFSKGTVHRVSDVIWVETADLIKDLEQWPEVTASLINDTSDVSPSNKKLIAFLESTAKTDQNNLYAFYVGSANGNQIEVNNLGLVHQTHYVGDPSKLLPNGIVYALREIDRSQSPPKETWYYKDKNFKLLAQESISPVQFDPRERPWYIGAKKEGKLHWSDIYAYEPSKERGITVSQPVFNKRGDLIAVIGADLSLIAFENFLVREKIGETGQSFILNGKGEIIIPKEKFNVHIPKESVSAGFQYYKEQNETDFVIENNKIQYLVSVRKFPPSFEQGWLILVIVPLKDFFADLFRTEGKVVIISLFILLISIVLIVYFSKRISEPIVQIAREVDKIQRLELESEIRVKSNIREIHLLDESMAAMRVAIRSFGRYIPKEILKQLIQKGQEIALGGEKKEITILFTDIAGFTSISETLSMEVLTPLLAEYFDALSKAIILHQGTIDKYIGDSVMALWGAPSEIIDHPKKACIAALHSQAVLATLNRKWQAEGKPVLFTRMGINTGVVIVGNIGTKERMNYTVIGDAVNVASRLEGIGKTYHTSIIISDEVYKRIGNEFLVRPLDVVAVKGKKETTKIYELVAKMEGISQILPTPQQLELCSLFTKAYDAFWQGDSEKAKALFEAIRQTFPDDYPTQFYLERMQKKV